MTEIMSVEANAILLVIEAQQEWNSGNFEKAERYFNKARHLLTKEEKLVTDTMAQMPKYKCHKEVWALKIIEVNQPDECDAKLHFEDGRFAPILVDAEFVRKHAPMTGGYYVVYEDGYKSWSPAEAFEAGYTLIE